MTSTKNNWLKRSLALLLSFVMMLAMIPTSVFAASTEYTITVKTVENGTIAADKTTASKGDTVTLSATPADGYAVSEWIVTDGNNNPITVKKSTFTMPASDVTVSATILTTREALTVLAAKVDGLNSSDYTAESWEELRIARSEFDTADIPNMQDFVVNYLLNNLQEKYDDLVPVEYSITVSSVDNGTITADKASAAMGDKVTLSATANDGYVFYAWVVTDANNNAVTVTDNEFTMPASAVNVSATFLSENKIELIALAEKIDGLNSSDYTEESWEELRIARSEFNTADVPNMMDFVVTYLLGNLQEKYDALVPVGYAVTVSTVDNGTITADKETAAESETVSLTATPAEGYALYKWEVTDAGNNEITVTDNVFTMPASAVTVSATFLSESRVQLSELLVYVDSLNPADYTEDSYNAVKEVRDSMSEETVTSAPDFVVTYMLNELQGLVDALVPAGYAITVSTVDNGTITADKETAAEGETVILTATPAEGYALYKWEVTDAGNNEITVTENVFTMPASAVTVSATFLSENRVQLSELLAYVDSLNPADYTEDSYNAVKEVRDSMSEETVTSAPDFVVTYMLNELQGLVDALVPAVTYVITVDTVDNGTIAADKETAAEGATITLTATAADGYALYKWAVSAVEGAEVVVTDNAFTMPASAVTVSATFLSESRVQLSELLAYVDSLDPADYTEDSYNAVKEVRDSMSEETVTSAPDFVVTYMLNELQGLVDALVPAGEKYEVTVNVTENGTVVADKTSAESGSTVTLTVTPDAGYELGELTVTDAEGAEVTVTDNTFTMPASAVTVDAIFIESGIELEDGTYMLVSTSGASDYISRNIRVDAKDGQYKLTFYFDVEDKWQFDGDYTSNRQYIFYGEDDVRLKLVEILTEEAFATNYNQSYSAIPFAAKNLISGYDLENAGFTDAVKALVSEDNNDLAYTTEYVTLSDGSLAYSIVVDCISKELFLHGLREEDRHSYGTDEVTTKYYPFYKKMILDVDNIVRLPDTLAGVSGTISYNYDALSNKAFRKTAAEAEYTDGKLYVTYDVVLDGAVNSTSNGLSAELLNENYEEVACENNKFTVEYESIDDIIRGERYIVKVLNNNSYRGLVYGYQMVTLTPDFSHDPVVLEDAETGIKLYTSTKYVSTNAKLNIALLTDESSDAWTQFENDVNYNKVVFFTFSVTDNEATVSNFGGNPILEIPLSEGMNDDYMRAYLNLYDESSDAFAFGWKNGNGVVVDDVYSLFIDKDYMTANWAIYDEKMATSDGSALENGTYTVPITTFNASATDQTSMSAACLGDTATLVVKDDVKYLKLDFAPVDIGTQQGYMIQMWVKNIDGEFEEIAYTAYYKNADGTFFTDDLNVGTLNYYPETGYMMLPTDDAQFMTRFRVSAMDAIIDGVTTRDAIFTIYYDDAEKISDETPDAPIKEALAEEIAVAETVDSTEYTYVSYSDMDEAYKVAKAVYNNAASTIADMTEAHNALRTAIDNLVSTTVDTTKLAELLAKAEEYEADDYTTETFANLTAAISEAKAVLNDEASTQVDIDAAKEALQAAIDGLVTKDSVSLDASNLADGTYTVQIEMRTATDDGTSMANGAIGHEATLVVKDGVGKLYVDFVPMEVSGSYGSLLQYWIYSESTPDAARSNMLNYSANSNLLTEAEYVSYHTVGAAGTTTPINGTPSEAPASDNKIRAAQICITLPYMGEENNYNKIYSRVSVDMMEMLGVGEQNVLLKINYNTLEVVDAQATLKLDKEEVSLIAGMTGYNTATVTATLQNANGYTVSWTSSNEKVATVKDGVITAIAGGEATITCTATNGTNTLTKTVEVTVTGNTGGAAPVEVESVTTSGKTATATMGGSVLVSTATDGITIDGNTVIVDGASDKSNITSAKVVIPADTADALAASTATKFVFETDMGSVTVDKALMNKIASQNAEVILTVSKATNPNSTLYAAVYELTLTSGGKTVSFGSGTATVKVDCDDSNVQYAYCLVDGLRSERQIVTINGGTASWTTNHFSIWALSTRELTTPETTETEDEEDNKTNEEENDNGFFLADGEYYVNIALWKASSNEVSMGNVAFANNSRALVTVKNGKITTVQVATNPVDVGEYHSAITSFAVSGASVKVLETGSMTTQPAGETYNYIKRVQFNLPSYAQPVDKSETTYVNVTFWVPDTPMDAAVGDTLNARLKFIWSTATPTKTTSLDSNDSTAAGKSEITGEEIKDVELKDEETGIKIETDTARISDKAEIKIEEVTSGADYDKVAEVMGNLEGWKLYSISAMVDGEAVAPEGAVKLLLPCEDENMTVYRINDDGSKTRLNGQLEDGYYVVNTSQLGLFVLVNETAETEEETTAEEETTDAVIDESETGEDESLATGADVEETGNGGGLWWLWIIVAVVAVGGVIFFIIAKKRKND